MDPKVLLTEIFELLEDMSGDIDHNDWIVDEIVSHVENYGNWSSEGGFRPDIQNVAKEWLTNKEAEAYNAPARNQKQFWDDSALGRFDL